MLVDVGYIPMDDWSGAYRFYIQDHLGNNRMVVHQSGTIEQVNNYYPYGARWHVRQQAGGIVWIRCVRNISKES